ncbi:hypothetical protein C1H46_003594 [Malus baccata]|uniref:Uncharacterized protein n=1 Tax=Malus baccata TaxID=106549 RepID=A0A540NI25_MALBA|nr:hypothetical protein C1H46_003594 [Malus baccata]
MARKSSNDMDGRGETKTTHATKPPSLPPPQTQRGHNDISKGRALGCPNNRYKTACKYATHYDGAQEATAGKL